MAWSQRGAQDRAIVERRKRSWGSHEPTCASYREEVDHDVQDEGCFLALKFPRAMGTASTLKGKGSVTTIAPMHPKPRRATAPTPAHRSSASSGTTARNSWGSTLHLPFQNPLELQWTFERVQ
eukprot:1186151-Prorocentrum_minimum.AAC.1